MTFSPSAVSSTISSAAGKPAAAGAVRSRSGKYISERCATYISATKPPKQATAMRSHLSKAMAD